MRRRSNLIKWANALRYTIVKKLKRTERIYFLSDLHLGDGSFTDQFGKKDKELIDFLNFVELSGDKLVIIGDAMDFIQGGSFDRILKKHRDVLKKLKELADKIKVIYVYGNHDTDIVLFEDILNFEVCDLLEIGDDILVKHGHGEDLYSAERFRIMKPFLKAHDILQRIIKSRIYIPLVKFNTFPNRFAHYFVYRVFQMLKIYAWFAKILGRKKHANKINEWMQFIYKNVTNLGGLIFNNLKNELVVSKYQTIVCGHSHRPGIVKIGDKQFVNTGSWVFESAYYSYWDGKDFKIKHWITKDEVTDEFYKDLDKRSKLSLKMWWKRHYKGFLRFKFK